VAVCLLVRSTPRDRRARVSDDPAPESHPGAHAAGKDRQMRRSIRIGLSTAALVAAAILGPDPTTNGVTLAHAEAESVDDCVGFSLVESEDGLTYELANDCEKLLSCEMSWTLVCGDDRKGPTHPGARQFAVAKNAAADVEISVAPCGAQSWAVENVAWACLPR